MKRITEIDQIIGRKLRMKRIQLGLSQEELSKSIGVTFQQIQKYEKGTNRISGGNIYKFAKILKVSPLYFYEDFENDNDLLELGENDRSLMILSRYLNSIKNPKKKTSFIRGLIEFLNIINKKNVTK